MPNCYSPYNLSAGHLRLGKGRNFLTSILFIFVSLATVHELLRQYLIEESNAAESNMASPNRLSFRTVAKGYRSGIRESLQTVIRNQTEWQKLWQRHTSSQPKPPPPPAMDFKSEMVAAVFLGEKPTGGYGVEIVRVERNHGTFTVLYKESEPPPGAMTTQALTQPFHIVRIPATDAEKVVFRRLP